MMSESGAGPSEAPPEAGQSAPPAPPVDPAVAFREEHVASNESFFQVPAEELAVSLLGQYLYFHDSEIVVRILETEAYPEGDRVYDKRFRDKEYDLQSLFKRKGGTLLAWVPSHYKGDHAKFKDLYITAGPPNTSDLVHIRSCEPVLGEEEISKRRGDLTAKMRKNLLIGPQRVSEGLRVQSWEKQPKLYKKGGVQLFFGVPNVGEKKKRGERILNQTLYNNCEGTGSLYRFALTTKNNYKFKNGLQDHWDE